MGRPAGHVSIRENGKVDTLSFQNREDLENKDLVEGRVYSVYAIANRSKRENKDKDGLVVIGRFRLIKKYKHHLLMEEVNCGYKECFKNCTANHRFKEV